MTRIEKFAKQLEATPIVQLQEALTALVEQHYTKDQTKWAIFYQIRKALMELRGENLKEIKAPDVWKETKKQVEEMSQSNRQVQDIPESDIDFILELEPTSLEILGIQLLLITGRRLSDFKNEFKVEDGDLYYQPSKKEFVVWCKVEELLVDAEPATLLHRIQMFQDYLKSKNYEAVQKLMNLRLKEMGLAIRSLHGLRSAYAQYLTAELDPQQRPHVIKKLLCHNSEASSNRYNLTQVVMEPEVEEPEPEPENKVPATKWYCSICERLLSKGTARSQHNKSKTHIKKLEQ